MPTASKKVICTVTNCPHFEFLLLIADRLSLAQKVCVRYLELYCQQIFDRDDHFHLLQRRAARSAIINCWAVTDGRVITYPTA